MNGEEKRHSKCNDGNSKDVRKNDDESFESNVTTRDVRLRGVLRIFVFRIQKGIIFPCQYERERVKDGEKLTEVHVFCPVILYAETSNHL